MVRIARPPSRDLGLASLRRTVAAERFNSMSAQIENGAETNTMPVFLEACQRGIWNHICWVIRVFGICLGRAIARPPESACRGHAKGPPILGAINRSAGKNRQRSHQSVCSSDFFKAPHTSNTPSLAKSWFDEHGPAFRRNIPDFGLSGVMSRFQNAGRAARSTSYRMADPEINWAAGVLRYGEEKAPLRARPPPSFPAALKPGSGVVGACSLADIRPPARPLGRPRPKFFADFRRQLQALEEHGSAPKEGRFSSTALFDAVASAPASNQSPRTCLENHRRICLLSHPGFCPPAPRSDGGTKGVRNRPSLGALGFLGGFDGSWAPFRAQSSFFWGRG